MFRNKNGLLSVATLAAIFTLGTPQFARADLQIILRQTGFADVYFSVATIGGTGQLNAPASIVFGNFTITGLAGSQTNSNGPGGSILQSTNLTITNNTGTAHSLQIFTFGNNFTLPTGSSLLMTSSGGGNIFLPGTPGDTNVVHQGFINNANPAIDLPPGPGSPTLVPPQETTPGAQAAVFTGNSFGNGTLEALFNRLNANFSLTSLAMVNVGGSAGIHFTETLQVTAVPAPAAMILALTGLPCFAGAWLRRRNAVMA